LWSKDYQANLEWLNQQGDLIFPLSGQDLLENGIEAGPSLGSILKQTEEWWISKDFAPDKEDCLEYCLGFVG